MNEKKKDRNSFATESGTRNVIKYQDQNYSSTELKNCKEVTLMKFFEEYTLEKDGSGIEKDSWKLFIKKQFPNYEEFWFKFVVPRTKRPESIEMRDDLKLIEQKLISYHYSIIHNLYYVKRKLRLRKNFDREIFEVCYVRLSAAIDSCESFLYLYLIWDKGKNNTQEQIKLLLDKLCTNHIDLKDVQKFLDDFNQGKEDIIKKLTNERNISLNLIDKRKIIEKISKNRKVGYDWKKFYDLINSIRCYRNIIVHSWPIMNIDDKFPKRGTVTSLKNWLDIDQQLRNNKKNVLDKFDNMKKIITLDFSELLEIINDIWGKVVI